MSKVDLLGRLLTREPEERIALHSIAAHPWVTMKSSRPEGDILGELKDACTEASSKLLDSALKQISCKNWKQFKGFTARRSRPGSACDFRKEISEFLHTHHQEIEVILSRFRRGGALRKITEDFDEYDFTTPERKLHMSAKTESKQTP